MATECTQVGFEFHPLNQRQLRAQFDGGTITSDGGGLLLREVEKRTGNSASSLPALATTVIRSGSNTRCRNWWRSGFMVWPWATKTSTITSSCAGTLCWRCWWRSRIRASKYWRARHVEPTETNQGYGQRPAALQENRAGPWGGGSPVGGSASQDRIATLDLRPPEQCCTAPTRQEGNTPCVGVPKLSLRLCRWPSQNSTMAILIINN